MIPEATEYLLNFGAIGIVCAWLMYQYMQQQKREDILLDRLTKVIDNNTIALTRFYEWIRKHGGD